MPFANSSKTLSPQLVSVEITEGGIARQQIRVGRQRRTKVLTAVENGGAGEGLRRLKMAAHKCAVL